MSRLRHRINEFFLTLLYYNPLHLMNPVTMHDSVICAVDLVNAGSQNYASLSKYHVY